MYSIRQEELFSLQELMEMSPENKYSLIFNQLNLAPALRMVSKNTNRGRPEELNYAAMIYALLIGKIERIPTTKDILRRLKTSVEFRITCRFRGSDALPSEASFSRLYTKLADSGVLWMLHEQMIHLARSTGFIPGDVLAFDSTHIEADERSTSKKTEDADTSNTTPEPVNPQKNFKRGRPKREEVEQRKKDREAWEASLPLFERKIEELLPYTFEEIAPLIPKQASSSAKTDTSGKLMWWHGYKLHILTDSESQYVLTALFSSAKVNDGKMAIPLLKKFREDFPDWRVKHTVADAGYDYLAVYKQTRAIGAWPLIDFNERSKTPPEGYNADFSPICEKGQPYVYDSFDSKYERLKFTRPKACAECPLDGRCQKVKKVKVEDDLRRFTVPARASQAYEKLFNKRTAVERVFAYLKEGFGLGISQRRGKRAEVDAALSVLSYTLCRFAVDLVNSRQKKQAA